jgi:hypothetical protein
MEKQPHDIFNGIAMVNIKCDGKSLRGEFFEAFFAYLKFTNIINRQIEQKNKFDIFLA